MNRPNPDALQTVEDARVTFDYYLQATASFRRVDAQAEPGPKGDTGVGNVLRQAAERFSYPEATIQVDSAVFASAFNCLWSVLQKDFDMFLRSQSDGI